MEYKKLISHALTAMERSYSPYSDFKVGAALLCNDGSVYTGCNIENASYGATCCAERTAFFEAVKKGHKEFDAISIVGGKKGNIDKYCTPCGICRQVMSEFCNDSFKIILYNGDETRVATLGELLPFSFNEDIL